MLKKFQTNFCQKMLLSGGFSLGFLFLFWLAFLWFYQNRFYPGIKINNQPIGGLTREEAKIKLQQTDNKILPLTTIKLIYADISLASNSAQLGLKKDYDTALNQAFDWGHTNNWLLKNQQIIQALFQPPEFTTPLQFDSNLVSDMVKNFKNQVDKPGQIASATLTTSGSSDSLFISPGEIGLKLLEDETKQLIFNQTGKDAIIEAVVISTGEKLDKTEIWSAQKEANRFVGKTIKLKAHDQTIKINDQKIVELLAFPNGLNTEKLQQEILIWQKQIDRPPQNAVFEYDPQTLKVTNFVPDQPGIETNPQEIEQAIKETIEVFRQQDNQQNEIEKELSTTTTQPQKTLADTNNLGIKEKIGFGDSYYYHSIPSRIHNVAITAEKINYTIVPPGKEFSFNQTIGEVSSKTGYQPAYVIKNGQTVLGDGGGVCQVSTTVFRAALDAGLNITKRLPHSYRVSYYELNSKPGIDATVYAGNVDLRFINDTPGHILLISQADSKNLYLKVEIFGTSDGRTTAIINHKTWDYLPPLPTQYIPDPSLPHGVKKQIDWAVAGIKAEFTHIIKNKEGEIISEKKYFSNYRPWAAKYLVGI